MTNEWLEFFKIFFPCLTVAVLGLLAYFLFRHAGSNHRERTERIRENVEDSRRTVDTIQDGNNEHKHSVERAEQGIDNAQDGVRQSLDLIEEIRKRNKV